MKDYPVVDLRTAGICGLAALRTGNNPSFDVFTESAEEHGKPQSG